MTVVLAMAVGGGVLLATIRKGVDAETAIPAVTSPPDDVTVSLLGSTASVLVGAPDASVTVDIYEDYLCPACQQFEQQYAELLHNKLRSGAIRVHYRPVNLLDRRSDPPGCSMRAANAALSVAQLVPSLFLDYHHSLFVGQPAEGSGGYTTDQLVDLGRRLGVPGDRLRANVESAVFEEVIRDSLAAAAADSTLRTPGRSFGTPTVLVNSEVVNPWAPGWLDRANAVAS